MRNKIIAIVSVAMLGLGACGGDNDTNNGTTAGNNGTSTGNNGTSTGNNGTSTGNNGTSTGNNGTSTGNNGTSTGNNGTSTAGPSAMCTKYCTEQGTTCTFDGANKQYDNEVSCLAACATITDSGTDCSADPATCSSDVADTIQCRLYHLNAAKTDAMTHCPHSGPAITVGVCM